MVRGIFRTAYCAFNIVGDLCFAGCTKAYNNGYRKVIFPLNELTAGSCLPAVQIISAAIN
jgi:hypothetical protein